MALLVLQDKAVTYILQVECPYLSNRQVHYQYKGRLVNGLTVVIKIFVELLYYGFIGLSPENRNLTFDNINWHRRLTFWHISYNHRFGKECFKCF